MIRPVLQIVDPGLGVSLQDLGRRGWKRFGVPPGGAMDRHASRLANRLLGNPADAPVIEILLAGARFRARQRMEVALTGAAATGAQAGAWSTFWLAEGEEFFLDPPSAGVWSYLAVGGGWIGPRWFGSVSAYPRGGMGEALQSGDVLESAGAPFAGPVMGTGIGRRWVQPGEQRDYLRPLALAVWRGPEWELFPERTRAAFFRQDWTLSARSDRTGYRLEGSHLRQAIPSMPSEPVIPGSIQVPPDGYPIITQRDGPTVGGYPKLGLVDPDDLSWLAQHRPGQRVRFVPAQTGVRS